MEYIFHEKQEGQLCAQHALNALLQGAYFTAIELAEIAKQIDEDERSQISGQASSQSSQNMDDTGFFSVQVIARALQVWSLDLIPFNSQNRISEIARKDPTTQKAYICHFQEHWFTIRKIGTQWFNMNSLLTSPLLISDTYLSLLLTQLQQEGYTIFIVNGILPSCKADHVLETCKVEQIIKPKLINETKDMKDKPHPSSSDNVNEEERRQLEAAIKLSMESNVEAERRQLEAALALSLEFNQDLTQPVSKDLSTLTDDEMLDAALSLSLEGSS